VFTERLTPTAGPRLNVAEGPPAGPPLWLLHGVGRRWQDFSPLLGGLASHWQVWASDHRGHGGSDRVPGRYLVPDYIADTAELIAWANAPVVLVGHSLGALTALGVASAVPDRVRAVLLLDPPGSTFLKTVPSTGYATTWRAMQLHAGSTRPTGEIARELAEVRLPGNVRLGDQRDAAALRFVARCVRDLDPAALDPPLETRWLGDFDLFATAEQVKCPALLVVADPACGGMLLPPDADRLAAALPDVARVDLPGVGHLIHWQDPAACTRLLHSFLASL
jgi:pimeloyl-ACP methyl ester carboxylesterase